MRQIEQEVLHVKSEFAKVRERLYYAIQSGNEDNIKKLKSEVALYKQHLHDYNKRYEKLERKNGMPYRVGGVLS
jgi:hypothetical protein